MSEVCRAAEAGSILPPWGKRKVSIFTDSPSNISVLLSSRYRGVGEEHLYDALEDAAEKEVLPRIRWVRSHADLIGNEIAFRLGAQGGGDQVRAIQKLAPKAKSEGTRSYTEESKPKSIGPSDSTTEPI